MFADGGSKSDVSADGHRAANSALHNAAHGLNRLNAKRLDVVSSYGLLYDIKERVKVEKISSE